MRIAPSAQVLANSARMRGDRRRHVPVLLLQIGVDLVGLGDADVAQNYRIIGAPSLEVAREAKDILIACGWFESAAPNRLSDASFSLAPPNGDCDPTKTKSTDRGKGTVESRESGPTTEEAGRIDDSDRGSPQVGGHAPNLRALSILKEVRERQRVRLSSESGKTQEYLREARSGGMYGYGDSGDDK